MRRFLVLLMMAVMFVNSSFAQDNIPAEKTATGKLPFSVKAYAVRGTYLDNSSHFTKFGAIYPTGINLGFEFPSAQQKPWQSYLNNPTVGVGVSAYNFGNDVLGGSIAVYPYVLLDAVDSKYLQLRFKVAGGIAYVSETWYTQEEHDADRYSDHLPTYNSVFGAPFNVYLNAGVNLNFPITKAIAVGGELGFFHISNGRTAMPNIGMNTLYGSVGFTAAFNNEDRKAPIEFPDLPYDWALNITGSLGRHQSWMDEPKFMISTFHIGSVYHVNNWYGVGPGLDVFYNDAIDKNTERDLYCKGFNGDGRVCLSCKDGNYTTADKIRAGLSLNNEFKFGVITALVDWGVYFYNPARNYYYDYHDDHRDTGVPAKRPLFYETPNGAGGEEAFHYIRFGIRARVWDNIYLQASAKTHMHICEYIEFGAGYQIPFLKKSNRKDRDDVVFHYKRNWWKNY